MNSIELNFKTIEPNGLILHNPGRSGLRDYLSLETYDGILYVNLELGNPHHMYPFGRTPSVRVDDGQAHNVKVCLLFVLSFQN